MNTKRVLFTVLMIGFCLNSVGSKARSAPEVSNVKIQNAKYSGLATGYAQVKTNSGYKEMLGGETIVTLQNLNMVFHPIKYFKERKLIISTGGDNFSFSVPEKQIQKDGSFILDSSATKQDFSLSFMQESKLKNQNEVTEIESCTYYGYCFGCGLGMDGKSDCSFKYQSCSGTERVLNRYDIFDVSIKIQIEGGKNKLEIRTNPQPLKQKVQLKTLNSCG